jgi:polyribonucleotide nucleotidyltransferase
MNPVGKHKAKKPFPCREEDWERVGQKIESSVREGMKDWIGKEEHEKKEQEWEEIARKIEEKVRKAIKDWLDKP